MKPKKRLKDIKNISKDRKFRKIMESMKKTFAKAEKRRRDFLEYLTRHYVEGENEKR